MIGIFDSGCGGLTILKRFLDSDMSTCRLQQYDYIYLGDNARAPYGSKSQDAIYGYTKQAVDFLFKNGCRLIIVACNTASAEALKKVQQEWLVKNNHGGRVLGVVVPVVEEAVEIEGGRIGVIGTKATIESEVYNIELKKLKKDIEIYSHACPLLVPLVEEGWIKKAETKMILKKYLRPLKEKRIDTLILGCTHYSFLIDSIKRIMGKNCQVLDSPKIVAKKLKNYLERHPEIESKLSKNKKRIYYTTDDPQRFKQFSNKFFGEDIKEVKRVEL